MDNPTALHNENLPPTQFHIVKTFAGSMPKAPTASKLVETATKCWAMSASVAVSINHSLMVKALEIVSCVVKVLETIKKRVVSGFKFLMTSVTWSPSTLETK